MEYGGVCMTGYNLCLASMAVYLDILSYYHHIFLSVLLQFFLFKVVDNCNLYSIKVCGFSDTLVSHAISSKVSHDFEHKNDHRVVEDHYNKTNYVN